MNITKSLVWLVFLFSFVNVSAQENAELDSIVEAFEIKVEPIELIHHPIQKHFSFSQNKLEINQSSRELAATFDDPSRVLYRHTGISIANDQNNSIVYRGLPSEFVKWSIDGAEIINPNHLSNAGRLSDQSSPSAGGVLAIPFEVVNKFSFYGNAYGPEQINSVSAVSDFNFDIDGNNFFKVGLLGMEAGFQTKGKVKVKGNFRYSTVGLLSDFGVNFDGESIKFYDGFVKADITDKISFVGVAGNSKNFHESLTNIEDATQLKDLQEIDFESKFFIAGIKYKGEKYNHSFFVSQRNSNRTSRLDESLFQSPEISSFESFSRNIEKYSYNGYRKLKMGEGDLNVGMQFLLFYSELASENFESLNENNGNVKVYANYKYLTNLGDVNFKIEPGLAIVHIDNFNFNPSLFAQISYDKFLLDFNYACKNVQKEFNQIGGISRDSDLVESYSISLRYQLPKQKFSINTRMFYLKTQTLNYLLQSILNGTNKLGEGYDFNDLSLRDESQIDSKGIELMIDKSWSGGWYAHANATFFDAQYSNLTFSNIEVNTNENFKSIYNFVFTKEFYSKRNNKWVVNLAYHQRGGAYQNTYDWIEGTFVERRLSAYYRIDARFQYNWNSKNTLTLDIQNLTNNLNDAYYFYDAYLNKEVLQKQLGTIPILSYKRVF